jgi:hypothetical protein
MFRPNILITKNKVFVSIKMIESMTCIDDNFTGEDIVVDTLLGDLTLIITTVSGARHEVSVREQLGAYYPERAQPADAKEIEKMILNYWIDIISEK